MTTGFLFRLAFGSLAVLAFFGLHLWLNVRHPGAATRRWNSRLFALCQGAVAASAFLDWAYGPYLLSPLGLASLGQPLLLVPSLFALALLAWRHLFPGAYGVVSIGAALQFASVVPLLLLLERRLTVSFLATGTVLALGASAISLFVLSGDLVQDVAPPTTWRGRVTLLHRERAYAALQGVARSLGLTWRPPRTILELGSAHGHLGDLTVGIDSSPRLWPLRYRVEVRVQGAGGPLPAGPAPAPWQTAWRDGARIASVQSARAMPFDEDSLRAILAHLTESSS